MRRGVFGVVFFDLSSSRRCRVSSTVLGGEWDTGESKDNDDPEGVGDRGGNEDVEDD